MGLTGQVTGKQVADWANQIEADIGAAFDDKAITQAATTLIRFGKTTPKNLRPALEVVADLATKTGDVESAASLLAKALADPTKAAGKLARVGIILTKEQQKQIKAFVEGGDAAAAQAVILDSLAKSTKGAAAASQGPYARAQAVLKDVSEDARKALAEGFLPVIQKVADRLGKAIGDPKFIAGLREFGQNLAGGLDQLIDIAAKLPWTQIGESLKIAGAGAKTLLQAFTALPPWVQTAVLTGWGLNKLTGGALGGIVGELAKGVIKGVLGINAGVVNINAATVNGAGGLAGAAGGRGGLGVLGAVLPVAVIIAGITEAAAAAIAARGQVEAGVPIPNAQGQFGPRTAGQMQHVQDQQAAAKLDALKTSQIRNSDAERTAAEKVKDAVFSTGLAAKIALDKTVIATGTAALKSVAAIDAAKTAITTKTADIGMRSVAAADAARAATAVAGANTAAAARTAGQITAQAIRDKDLSVVVNNPISISVRTSIREQLSGTATYHSYYKIGGV
jgi:hypothetical protein